MMIAYDFTLVKFTKNISGMNLFIKVVWDGLTNTKKNQLKSDNDLSSMMNSVSISSKRVCNGPLKLSSVFSQLGEEEQEIWNEKAAQICEDLEEDILPKWITSKFPNDIELCEKKVSRDMILSYRWTYRRIFEKMKKVLSSGRKGVSQAKAKINIPETIFKKTKCIVKLNCGYVVWNSLFQPILHPYMKKDTGDVRYFQLKDLKIIKTFLSFHGRDASVVKFGDDAQSRVALKVVVKQEKKKIGYVVEASEEEWTVQTSSNNVETYSREDPVVQVFPFTIIYNRKLLTLTLLFDRMSTRDGRLLFNQCS